MKNVYNKLLPRYNLEQAVNTTLPHFHFLIPATRFYTTWYIVLAMKRVLSYIKQQRGKHSVANPQSKIPTAMKTNL